MALDYNTEFPSRSQPADSSYPFGSARNNLASPGDGTNTPYVARRWNDFLGMFQGLLADAGLTADGNPDTVLASQYLDAMRAIHGRTHDTIATVDADTRLVDDTYVDTAGYTTVFDGGHGRYQVGAAGSFGTADGGLIIDLPTAGKQLKLIHNGVVTLEQFGCVGDGVTDDAARMNAAFATGLTVEGKRGAIYAVKSLQTVTNGFTFVGDCTVLYDSDYPALQVHLPWSASINVSAIVTNNVFGSVQVSKLTLSGTPPALDSVILLYSQDNITADPVGKIGELLKVIKVSGSDIWVDRIVSKTYATSPAIVTMSNDEVVVSGPRFVGNGDITATGISRYRAALELLGCRDPKIDVSFSNCFSRGLFIVSCYMGQYNVAASYLRDDLGENGYGYGVSYCCASRGGSIHVTADHCRHAFTTNVYSVVAAGWYGEPREATVTGRASACTGHAWDTHAGAYDITFNGTEVDIPTGIDGAVAGNQYGYQVRSVNTKFIGCSIDSAPLGAIAFNAWNVDHGVSSVTRIIGFTCKIDPASDAAYPAPTFIAISGAGTYAADHKIVISSSSITGMGINWPDNGPELVLSEVELNDNGLFRINAGNTVELKDVRRSGATEPILVKDGSTLRYDGLSLISYSGSPHLLSVNDTSGTATIYRSHSSVPSGVSEYTVSGGITLTVNDTESHIPVIVLADGTTSFNPINYGKEVAVITQNTAPTSLVITGGKEGQIVRILINDANTTIPEGFPMRLSGSASFSPAAKSTISLIRVPTEFWEIGRSTR